MVVKSLGIFSGNMKLLGSQLPLNIRIFYLCMHGSAALSFLYQDKLNFSLREMVHSVSGAIGWVLRTGFRTLTHHILLIRACVGQSKFFDSKCIDFPLKEMIVSLYFARGIGRIQGNEGTVCS